MDNIEKIKKLKIKTLVQTKKAEYWIKGTKEDSYNDLVKDFDECTRQIKHMIQIRKNFWYIHLIAQTIVFIRNPIKYLTVRIKARKRIHVIDSYWEMKSIKKEWDDDYEVTEKIIDKNYELMERADKIIEMFEKRKAQQ
jgi:hypothetical protein